jgi:hypothetical protein
VDLYINSPIRLHGEMLNYLSTGTTLPLPYTNKHTSCERSFFPLHIGMKHLLTSAERKVIVLVRNCTDGTCIKYLYYLINNEQISSTTAVLMHGLWFPAVCA